MKKILIVSLLVIIIILTTVACSSKSAIRDISKVLSIDLSKGTISQINDSHGGFHGDGATFAEIVFDDDNSNAVIEEIEDNIAWSKMPLTDNLNTVVYGKMNASEIVGPYVINEDGEPLFPAINNGYYYFLDRHSESSDANDDKDLLNRYSFNFTIAIYDTNNHTMYYYELDT